jgi:hypothetical protein
MKKGDKVKCISDYENHWGNCEQIKNNLVVGEVYEVEKVEEHSWHTKVWLKGYKNPFNSVHLMSVGGGEE